MSILATFKVLFSVLGALLPKGKQIYAERSAGKTFKPAPVDVADDLLDEALSRLGSVDLEKPWWKDAMVAVGAMVTRPDSFKKPAIREWLSQADVRRQLKSLARAAVANTEARKEDYEALVASHMEKSYENKQYAESSISLAVAVMKASVLGAVRDPGTAAIVQASAESQQDLLMAVKENLEELIPQDLTKLTELARSYANLIPDDIGGTQLERTSLLEAMDQKLTAARLVQIRGLPGSGKSVLMRRAVQRALEHGPVLFLKAEQLEGTSWISYAAYQGISGKPLLKLLEELRSVGTPVLFIDAIDRVEKEQQPIILDVLRAVAESDVLKDWRVVVSLRDTGIEALRNWLGDVLNALTVDALDVELLNEEEAAALAGAKPHLRPLLFGSPQVQEIVRRPFFAKVLNQSYVADPSMPAYAPQSEVDLIENWWRKGGYNENGQNALERQRTLLNAAQLRARQLSQPIRLSQLASIEHIESLRADGILQNAREGVSIRFAHDIFFEWAFFYVLADRDAEWIDEIKASGEPPAVARVVELLAQWEFANGTNWSPHLAKLKDSKTRSQWLRAWLTGPLGTVNFEADERQFATAVFAEDFALFKKALVWFQAEKTVPNPNVLAGNFPAEKRQRLADLLGWPGDFFAWRRLIEFILVRISDIPPRLYPEIVAIFEVWQNAWINTANPTSKAILKRCATWLEALNAIEVADGPDANSNFWSQLPEHGVFRKSLVRLILLAARVEPVFAADYLKRMARLERIQDAVFVDVLSFSSTLAQSLPEELVEFVLSVLNEELPADQVAREREELLRSAERRKRIEDKPEEERSHHEQVELSHPLLFRSIGGFSYHDWQGLSIHDDHQSFWPLSPIKEPFHSLFKSAPEQALRLFRDLCNHAITAWRQLHVHSYDSKGTPVPIELAFPWGVQSFWGTDREYLWCRSTGAPKIIGCGFMALEEWCLSELEAGRPVDALIQQIVEGNECFGILGTAAMLVLHTGQVSDVTLPLVTSQRLLAADYQRMGQDLSPAILAGFSERGDEVHQEAVNRANTRLVRKTQLAWSIPRFAFAEGGIGERVSQAIASFQDAPSFEYEEHRSDPRRRAHLVSSALEYAELADKKNYKPHRVEGNPDVVANVFVNPSAEEPEHKARFEEATSFLSKSSLWTWASKSLDAAMLQDTFTVVDAIALAKQLDREDLFSVPSDAVEDDGTEDMHRGAIAATAAVVLNFRDGVSPEDLDWARSVLKRAIEYSEKPNAIWPHSSSIPWHYATFLARGLAGDRMHGTALPVVGRELLVLIAHPLEDVSLAAVEEVCKLWSKDAKLVWAGLILAFSLCHVLRRKDGQSPEYGEALHSEEEISEAVNSALAFYESPVDWAAIPLPPPAWVKRELGLGFQGTRRRGHQDLDADGHAWIAPDVYWRSEYAAKILQHIPFEASLNSDAKEALLDFLAKLLAWTNEKNEPSWQKPNRRGRSEARIFEWTHTLGAELGTVAGLLALKEIHPRFLEPIFGLGEENCWALLTPFASRYIAQYVYDAANVPADAMSTVSLCLDRLLQSQALRRDAYRSGEFSGFDQPRLVKTLMFVEIERADLAARYINGDWSEVSRILPLVDRFVRTGGWAASVMSPYLTLCERSKNNYPADAFADQVLVTIDGNSGNLKGWHGSDLPARIAELVQFFTDRETPMQPLLAQKFLRILDILVDMGDRRSAALQLSAAFREIQLT